MFTIVITDIDNQVTKYRIERPSALRIGRDLDNDIVLNSARVAAHHCVLTLNESELAMRDLGGTYRTLLNGKPIARQGKTRFAAEKDVIRIADCTLRVFTGDDSTNAALAQAVEGSSYIDLYEQLLRSGAQQLVGKVLSNRYTLQNLIGNGEWGPVYKAFDTATQKLVALRAIVPSDLSLRVRFHWETLASWAETVIHISHHNIAAYTDYGEDRGIHFMAMELIEGESIAKHLHRNYKFTLNEISTIFEAIISTIEYFRNLNKRHGNIHTENILLTTSENGELLPKLVDYFLDELRENHDEPGGTSQNVHIGGSRPSPARLRYMAPESTLGIRPIDIRSDLYSAGLILFELLAGRPPFFGEDGMEVLAQRLHREAPPLSKVAPKEGYSNELDEFLAELLKRDRAERPGVETVLNTWRTLKIYATPAPPETAAPPPESPEPAPPRFEPETVIAGQFRLTQDLGATQYGDTWRALDLKNDKVVRVDVIRGDRIGLHGYESTIHKQLTESIKTIQHPKLVARVGVLRMADSVLIISEDIGASEPAFAGGMVGNAVLSDIRRRTIKQAVSSCLEFSKLFQHLQSIKEYSWMIFNLEDWFLVGDGFATCLYGVSGALLAAEREKNQGTRIASIWRPPLWLGSMIILPPEVLINIYDWVPSHISENVLVFMLASICCGGGFGHIPYRYQDHSLAWLDTQAGADAFRPESSPRPLTADLKHLEPVLFRALAWNPAERHASMDEFLAALLAAQDQGRGSPVVQGPPPDEQSPPTLEAPSPLLALFAAEGLPAPSTGSQAAAELVLGADPRQALGKDLTLAPWSVRALGLGFLAVALALPTLYAVGALAPARGRKAVRPELLRLPTQVVMVNRCKASAPCPQPELVGPLWVSLSPVREEHMAALIGRGRDKQPQSESRLWRYCQRLSQLEGYEVCRAVDSGAGLAPPEKNCTGYRPPSPSEEAALEAQEPQERGVYIVRSAADPLPSQP